MSSGHGGRYPKGETAERQFPDEVRQAAYEACAAARKLHALTGERLWRPQVLTAPVVADLTDALARLQAVLVDAPRRRTDVTP